MVRRILGSCVPNQALDRPDGRTRRRQRQWCDSLNDPNLAHSYNLDTEIVRAIEFAAETAGRPGQFPSRDDIIKAVAPAFALDDLVLVGTLHMLSQIDVYTEALRSDSAE